MMLRFSLLLIFTSFCIMLGACGGKPTNDDLMTIYDTADEQDTMIISGKNVWWEIYGETADLTKNLTPMNLSENDAASCIKFGDENMFGAPKKLILGTKFSCGHSKFEVIDCDAVEECTLAEIYGVWRTGLAPDFRQLPFSYFYNLCRGVTSITTYSDKKPKVDFGSTLELRQGKGLLAQPYHPDCKDDPRRMIYKNAVKD